MREKGRQRISPFTFDFRVMQEPLAPDASSDVDSEYRSSNKRYCFGKLSKGWFIVLMSCSAVFLLLLIALLGVFVIGPAVAQHAIDDSSIEVSTMSVQAVGEDRLEVKLQGKVSNYAALEAKMGETQMEMTYGDKTFATLTMPEMTLNAAGDTALELEQVLYIADKDSFTEFAYDMMSKSETLIKMKGSVSLKALGITFSDLKMSKPVVIKGLNSFMNPMPRIVKHSVVGATADEILIEIDSCLYNNGTTQFNNLGVLNLDIVFEGHVVGYSTAGTEKDPLTLEMGDNCWTMTGHVFKPGKTLSSGAKVPRDAVQKLIGSISSLDDITLTLRGNQQTSGYPLMREAMLKLETHVTFNPLSVTPVNAAPSNTLGLITDYDSSSFGITTESLLQFTMQAPVSSLALPVQAVFNPTPSMYDYLIEPLGNGKKLGGVKIPEDQTCAAMGLAKTTCVSELDLSATTYIDVKALVYNPLQTELKVFGSQLNVTFSHRNEWDCHVPGIDMSNPTKHRYTKSEFLNTCVNVTDECVFNEKNHGSFLLARSKEFSEEPLVTLKPFEKKFLRQRLCLSGSSVSWMSAWLNKQILKGVDESPYFMWLHSTGTLDVEIGDYRTRMPTSQDIPIYGYYYKKEGMYPYTPDQWSNL